MDHAAKFDVANVLQQKHGSNGHAQFTERKIEFVFAILGAQASQDGRWRDFAGLDGHRNTQHGWQVRLDQLPIDGVREQRVNILKLAPFIWAEKVQILDATDPGHQFDTQ